MSLAEITEYLNEIETRNPVEQINISDHIRSTYQINRKDAKLHLNRPNFLIQSKIMLYISKLHQKKIRSIPNRTSTKVIGVWICMVNGHNQEI